MQSLVLGTAQWGLDYGVTNSEGRLSDLALLDLCAAARETGISSLDTANVYGDAEERIAQMAQDFTVVSKVSCAGLAPEGVLESVRATVKRVGRGFLDGCLVHDWPSLTPSERKAAATGLSLAREEGLIRLIGVSGYEADDFRAALEVFPSMDLAQGPLNALDQRLISSGVLEQLTEAGVAFEARSVFLQGVLLSAGDSPAAEPGKLVDHPDVIRFRSTAADLGLSPLELALAFVRSVPSATRLVIGVTTTKELYEILAAWEAPQPAIDWSRLQSADLDLLDPRAWTQENG